MMGPSDSEIGIMNEGTLVWAKWIVLGCTKDKLLSTQEGWISSLIVWTPGENDRTDLFDSIWKPFIDYTQKH